GVLLDESGPGSEGLGWRRMLLNDPLAGLDSIVQTSEEIHSDADALICIGIGGSYLGALAVIQALGSTAGTGIPIHFAGHHLGSRYLHDLLDSLDGKSVAVNVI